MKHRSRMLRRGFVCALGLALALPVHAHPGGHGPDVIADVVSAVASGNRVDVSLVLTGPGVPLRLVAVTVEGAEAVGLKPVDIRFAEDVPVAVTLVFARGVPDVFTVVFDFGTEGRRALSVVPQSANPD